jgi:CheY-like chemotaxis protein
MPGMSGLETLKAVRDRLGVVPCIFSSGHALGPDDIPTELQQATFFLPKPYRAAQLTDKVAEILDV